MANIGVAVRTVGGHYQLGLTSGEIADEMTLELWAVYAALASYHLNREEIEADIVANSEEVVKKEASLRCRILQLYSIPFLASFRRQFSQQGLRRCQ